MQTMMQAVEIREPGGPEVLRPVETAVPELRPGEVLIEVAAAGVNRPDVVQRQGRYPVPPDASPLPGLEVAGTIAAVGAEAARWTVGDRVMALTHGGGYAEYVNVDARHCVAWPAQLSAVEAAALPEVGFTVEFNMMMRAGLKSGETVLIHGGSSGIGSHAIQRAKAEGAFVIVTAGTQEKRDYCLSLGADMAVDYHEDWTKIIEDERGQASVDVVVDMVAGDYVSRNLSLMARDGRYALIALLGGRSAEVDMGAILSKALTLVGSTLRPQTAHTKALIASEVESRVLPLVAAGKIKPHIFETFPMQDAVKAHELMDSGRHMGKIVLTFDRNT